PGFLHDVCSGCHPMGVLSPWFRSLPLAAHGLRRIHPPASVAHPLDGHPPGLLRPSPRGPPPALGPEPRAYERLVAPFLRRPHELLADLLGPLRIPKHPIRLARFGLPGLLPAAAALRSRFRGERARALLAGLAAHSILPLERPITAAVAMIFALTAHVEDWPVAAGGSQEIAPAPPSYPPAPRGRSETGRHLRRPPDPPP